MEPRSHLEASSRRGSETARRGEIAGAQALCGDEGPGLDRKAAQHPRDIASSEPGPSTSWVRLRQVRGVEGEEVAGAVVQDGVPELIRALAQKDANRIPALLN